MLLFSKKVDSSSVLNTFVFVGVSFSIESSLFSYSQLPFSNKITCSPVSVTAFCCALKILNARRYNNSNVMFLIFQLYLDMFLNVYNILIDLIVYQRCKTFGAAG